ncbi:MAG: hypothetical protein ACO3PJ_08010, partial [Burkholderiaceae bacterium]
MAIFTLDVWFLAGQTAIGGITPDNSAMLDLQSTSKGVLFPRMTTAERDAISSPVTGLMIFNTTTGCLEINLGAGTANWQSILCTPALVSTLKCSCTEARQVGSQLMPGVAASGQSVRIAYTGGNGFAYDGQTVASTGVTGLTATLAAGTLATGSDSLTYTITGTPAASSGVASFALDIGGQTCTLNVPVGCGAYVDNACTWKVFSCYNLGAANTSADPFTPSWEINGDYYQWGYGDKAAPGPTDASTPNAGDNMTFPMGYTWRSTAAADGSWDDATKTANDPCPTGFRVPTKTQWEAVVANNATSDPAGASWTANNNNYSSGRFLGQGLFLPAAGSRGNYTGTLSSRGSNGYYWSSRVSGSINAWYLYFNSGGSG